MSRRPQARPQGDEGRALSVHACHGATLASSLATLRHGRASAFDAGNIQIQNRGGAGRERTDLAAWRAVVAEAFRGTAAREAETEHLETEPHVTFVG